MVSEHVVSLSPANWAAEVENASVPVLVDFGAAWCPPCRMIAPIIADLASEYKGVMKFGTLDTDAETALAAQFGVLGLPTLLVFRNGQVIDRVVGFTPKPALKKRIEALLG
ncbi:MAG TPA: thioredoxin [Symbiobacteriaceae bacterium]|nr:thioredoxin [Symbiobacteriaceae bacterium]